MYNYEEPKEKPIPQEPSTKVCSDHDEDCKEVSCHFRCWSGFDTLPVADGICPFIHTSN